MAQRALTIIRDRYTDFGPTLACEKLWECHGIRLANENRQRKSTGPTCPEHQTDRSPPTAPSSEILTLNATKA